MKRTLIFFSFFLFFLAAVVEAGYVYRVAPDDFHPKMEVASCYCECDGKFLLLLRHPKKPQGNTWCVPGGKLQKGETPLQAIMREVKEEIGLVFAPSDLKCCRTVYVRFPQQDFILHLFEVHLEEKPLLNVASNEHLAYLWVTHQEALELPLIPGGDECLEVILGSRCDND